MCGHVLVNFVGRAVCPRSNEEARFCSMQHVRVVVAALVAGLLIALLIPYVPTSLTLGLGGFLALVVIVGIAVELLTGRRRNTRRWRVIAYAPAGEWRATDWTNDAGHWFEVRPERNGASVAGVRCLLKCPNGEMWWLKI